ncbi:MAG: carboxypeptidase regulatory-like domain-containing protein [Acidobacteria bacterium]|nr:carboxypeptidase regulatory-like domain-containing protein [Acidobacteriota bacterium]
MIRGRVVRADTGEPLRRVQVRVDEWSTGDLSGPAATMTDAEGRYELTQLPAGRYQLKARRGGYVEVAYGQRRPFERGRPLELGERAVLQNIDFALPPGAVVTGRVVDETGEAFAHVAVSLAGRRYIDGARRLVSESGGSTDDRGEFRIFGVPPGNYEIVARFDGTDLGSRDRVRYVPTYYPGTPVASEAQRVTVGPGQEVSGITIALARAATATVRGVVRSSGQAPFGPFTFVIAREISGAQADGHMATAIAAGDGSFAIAGLLPGAYFVEARSPSGSEFASMEVVVEGSDVAGVTLTLSKGATARGRIHFDTGNPPQGLRPSQVFVMPTLVDDQMAGMSDMAGVSGGPPVTHDDWTFELQGLRGRGFIRAGTLSDWRMKRVRREGVDVTDTPLDFATDVDGLEIELTQRLTTVSGGVSDDRGGVALDATVIAFADDPGKWGPHSRFIESARPDQQGRFTIKGLPPGRYVAIAVGYLEPGEERDPDVLEAWRQGATPFTLSEGETHALDLRLSKF